MGTNELTEKRAIVEAMQDDGQIESYSDYDDLYKDILDGRLSRNQKARQVLYVKTEAKPGKWTELKKIAKLNFKTRCLYEPIHAHTMRGMLIGWLVGFILKGLDTSVLYFQADAGAGLLWLIFFGSFLLSVHPKARRIASFVPIIVGMLAIFRGMGNIWITVIAAGIVSFLGGAPFGMAIGTIVGHNRKRKLPAAPDAEPEGARAYVMGIAVPLMAGTAFLVIYFLWLTPLMVKWLVG